MKRILILLTLVLVCFIAINRQRIYLRDPLATVYRNDIKQEGVHVFINYTNDVLVQTGSFTRVTSYVVQNWNATPGTPIELKCVQELACLAQDDHVPVLPIAGVSAATMTNREISFTDETKATIRITLR
jgi:thiazole synthase ThiGH ThiG subunit